MIGLIPAGTLPVFAVEATEHNHDEGVSVACTCGTDDESIHATSCPAYVAPETAVCTCVEQCTEGNANAWCDVCGAEGADLAACGGEGKAVGYVAIYSYVGSSGDSDEIKYGVNAVWLSVNSGANDSYVKYKITSTSANNYTVEVCGYDGVTLGIDGAVTIPSSITLGSDQYSVVSIAANAFKDCTGLTSITLPDSVTSIGDGAFEGTEVECTTHRFSGDVCAVCGSPCDHGGETPTYANGVCTVCGVAHDPHSYTNGFCTVCGGYEPAVRVTAENYKDLGFTAENYEGYLKYYAIGNAGQLYWFADYVTEAQGYADAVLTDNIVVNPGTFDASGNYTPKDSETRRDWTRIGNANKYYRYQGTFDGQNHTISGLYFNDSNAEYVGLFGWVYNGTVKNVGVVNSYFSGYYLVGGVAGYNYGGTVQNCYNAGTINATYGRVGGVVGDNHNGGQVIDCYNTGNVSGASAEAGGVAGCNSSTVSNCYNTGTVSSNGYNVGGVIGYNVDGAEVTNCYYLTGCARDGQAIQNGIGAASKGSTTADVEGSTTGYDDFSTGKVAWLLNGETSDGVWKQTLDRDASPNFTGMTVLRTSGGGYINHDHVWSYAGEGSVIQVTCKGDYNCPMQEFTIKLNSPLEATYDGTTAHPVDITNNAGDLFSIPEDALTYTANDEGGELTNGLPVKAGSYTATLTLGEGANQAIASVTYSIAECPHVFENGTCTKCSSVCGTDVKHEFVDGVCKNCSHACEHTDGTNATWSDGFCTRCGAEHNHTTYTYIVAEDKTSITAKCEECGGTVGTLSFISESVEYGGHVLELTDVVSATGIFENGNVTVTSCHEDHCFDDYATSTDTTCQTAVGCKNAGTHNLTLTFTDGANSYEITDTITVTPKALTITEIYYDKIYDGTTTVVPNSVSISGEVEYKYLNWGYEYTYFDDVEVNVELVTFPDSVPGTYTTVHLSGITLSGASAGNYYISEEMDLTGEFVIKQIELTIKPVDQIIADGSAPDPTKFTVTNSNYETVTGLTIEGVEITAEGDTLYINTKNVTIKQGDTDVTAYYNINNGGEDDSYYTANASWACADSTFTEDGFCSVCSSNTCEVYQPATLNDNGTDDTYDDYYEIANAGQLYWFAQQVNNGNRYINGVLMNDIVVNPGTFAADGTYTPQNGETVRAWTPIGDYSNWSGFYGWLNGDGHTISGLYCTDVNYAGLIGYMGAYTYDKIGISNSYFKGDVYTGAIAAYMDCSTINNCFVAEDVYLAGSTRGGIAGYNSGGTINTSYSMAKLADGTYAGAVGSNYGTLNHCYYLSENETDDGGKTADQFASGEVAYLLQSGIVGEEVYDEETDSWVTQAPDEVWGQTIGTEDYPVFGGAKVYQKQNCNGKTLYRNIDEDVAHNYGELIPATEEVHTSTELKGAVAAHYYCTVCGTYFTEGKIATTLEALTGEAPTHTFGDEWQTGNGQHWKECSCGAKSEPAVHTYDATTHTCVCGDVEKIVSVTITWGSMSFTYDDNIPEGETEETGWTCDDGANVITIENTGNTDVTVTYTYEQVRTEIEGGFTDGTNTVTKMTILATEKKSVWLILKNKPTAALTDAHLGTVKLTIE